MGQHHSYWHKQSIGRPLFPDVAWSRPENRLSAGKLLIIGGNAYGFSAPAAAYGTSLQAGIGTARVMLPHALQKTVGKAFPAGEYAPSTPSGSFASAALAEMLDAAGAVDGLLLAGDLGRNSETAIVLEKLAAAYTGQLTVTQDAADYFTAAPGAVLTRPDSLFVISLAQLQKLAASSRFWTAFTFDMDLLRLSAALHDFTQNFRLHIVVRHLDNVCVAAGGEVSTTTLSNPAAIWRVRFAAYAATWWLQNPGKPFEALTAAVLEAGSVP